MQIPLQITVRDMPRSDALDARIREKAASLEHFHPRITSCRVTVAEYRKHHHQGRCFQVRVDVRVPGHAEIVSNLHHHEDVYVALRDAFDSTARQLEEVVRESAATSRLIRCRNKGGWRRRGADNAAQVDANACSKPAQQVDACGAGAGDVPRCASTGTGSDHRRIVRLDIHPDMGRRAAWHAVAGVLRAYLVRQSLSNVRLALDERAPAVDPRSGKLRQVIVAMPWHSAAH